MSTDVLAGGWAKALGGDRKQFNMFIEKMLDGFSYHKIVVNKVGKPVDYVFLEVNHAFEKMTGLKRERIIGKRVTEVLAGIEKDSADWIGVYGRVALTGEPLEFENHAEPLDKWYRISAYCPEKGYFVALFEDITEHKKAEEENTSLASFPTLNPNIIVEIDFEGNIEYVNPAAKVKLADIETLGSKHPFLADFKSMTQAIKEKTANTFTTEVKIGDDWYLQQYFKVPKSHCIRIYAINITERKKVEEALRFSEDHYRTLFSSIGEGFELMELIFDENEAVCDLRYLEVNDTYEKQTGLNAKDVLGKTVRELFPKIEGMWIEVFDKVIKTGLSTRLEDYYQDTNRYYSAYYFPFGRKEVGVLFSDITERKKAEEALKRSEQRYSSLFNSIPEGFSLVEIVHDENNKEVDFRFLEINPAYAKLVNKSREQIIGKTTREAIGPIEDYWYQLYDNVAKTGVAVHYENYVKTLDEYYEVYAWSADVANHVAILSTNITERKKAEKAIEMQAELIDLSPDAIIVRKLDGTITLWSKGAEKLYGWTKDEAIGKDINMLLKTKFPQLQEEILKKLKLDGKWSGEVVHACKNGDTVIAQSYWLAKFGADGKIVEMLESNVDITDRIQLQVKLEESAVRVEEYANQMEELATKRAEQLKNAERLAAIGATAGMVGHDIRNPLQAIAGDVYLLREEIKGMPESEEKSNAEESLEGIEKNVDYINKIVADLQDFARPLKPNAEETDLKLIIDDLLKKNVVPENVKVTVKVDTDARKVVADSTFINRIIYNLVNNAVQAMPRGGKLTVRAYKEGKDALITVQDTGVGIPDAVKGKLFTPMFTTKAKGQGFGLAVIKRMTEALGGTVSFESEEGKGTTFIVRLPPPPRS